MDKVELLELAEASLQHYVSLDEAGIDAIKDTDEAYLWVNEGARGSKARCLYFCLLAATEDK